MITFRHRLAPWILLALMCAVMPRSVDAHPEHRYHSSHCESSHHHHDDDDDDDDDHDHDHDHGEAHDHGAAHSHCSDRHHRHHFPVLRAIKRAAHYVEDIVDSVDEVIDLVDD